MSRVSNAVIGLSRWSAPYVAQFIVGSVVLLLTATIAGAQTVTANGTSGPIDIPYYETVTIQTTRGGTATAGDWVGIYAAGSPNSAYLDWYYLNGQKTAPKRQSIHMVRICNRWRSGLSDHPQWPLLR
jgi:hypothetical protein